MHTRLHELLFPFLFLFPFSRPFSDLHGTVGLFTTMRIFNYNNNILMTYIYDCGPTDPYSLFFFFCFPAYCIHRCRCGFMTHASYYPYEPILRCDPINGDSLPPPPVLFCFVFCDTSTSCCARSSLLDSCCLFPICLSVEVTLLYHYRYEYHKTMKRFASPRCKSGLKYHTQLWNLYPDLLCGHVPYKGHHHHQMMMMILEP